MGCLWVKLESVIILNVLYRLIILYISTSHVINENHSPCAHCRKHWEAKGINPSWSLLLKDFQPVEEMDKYSQMIQGSEQKEKESRKG